MNFLHRVHIFIVQEQYQHPGAQRNWTLKQETKRLLESRLLSSHWAQILFNLESNWLWAMVRPCTSGSFLDWQCPFSRGLSKYLLFIYSKHFIVPGLVEFFNQLTEPRHKKKRSRTTISLNGCPHISYLVFSQSIYIDQLTWLLGPFGKLLFALHLLN